MRKAVFESTDEELKFELARLVLGGDKPRSVVRITEMPYSAGVKLRELMIRRCYTDEEKMRRGLSSSEFGALQDLAKATNEEARHPALQGVGMVGHHSRIFHVWPTANGLWSPVPQYARSMSPPMQILCPGWHVDEHHPSTKFTLWHPGDYCPPSRLDDENLHWLFV